MHDTHLTITALILLLLIASGVAMITKWVPVPYTVALVVVGLVTSQLHFLPTIHISPELILLIFLGAAVRGFMESGSEELTRKPRADSLARGRRCHRLGGNHRSDPPLRSRPELVSSTSVWRDRISDRSYLCPGDL